MLQEIEGKGRIPGEYKVLKKKKNTKNMLNDSLKIITSL